MFTVSLESKDRLEALKKGHMKEKGARKLSEEYLEAIYELAKRQERTRPIDISRALNVAPSTVRKVLNRLTQQGYVSYKPYRELRLTELGEEQIARLKRRHDVMAKLFKMLGMGELESEVEAERLEHSMSERSLEFFEGLVNALEENEELLNALRSRLSRQ